MYRLQRKSIAAGKAFESAVEAQMKADSKDEAANTLVEAYKCYKKDSPSDGARCLDKAIDFFALRGQFRRGANFKYELGEVYENQLRDFKNAISSFQEAGEWYLNDSAEALSNKAYLKAADLCCEDEIADYLQAAEIYERIANQSLNNNLTRWSLKEYFLKAILCRLAMNDYPGAHALLQKFQSWEPSFSTTRECDFAGKLIDAVKESDSDGVAQASMEFDQFARLDSFKVKVLNKIKSGMSKEGVDLDEDDLC